MFADVFDMLFGCRHKKYSFPITTKKASNRSCAASVTGTYVVCLDCGREFPYDWNQMKVLSHASEHAESAPLTAKPVTGFVKAA
jgi:hypothetical protein